MKLLVVNENVKYCIIYFDIYMKKCLVLSYFFLVIVGNLMLSMDLFFSCNSRQFNAVKCGLFTTRGLHVIHFHASLGGVL